MAGTNEPDSEESQKNECSFEWDEESHLYYHAGTGFYHDPGAGWYYSSRDGLYYKYEDGNYVPLGSVQDVQSDTNGYGGIVLDNSVQDESCIRVLCHEDVDVDVDDSSLQAVETDACKVGEPNTGDTECNNSQLPENLPPPSEWLEDTLIDLYLSGYSKQAINATSDERIPVERNDGDSLYFSTDGAENAETDELEEGEWVPDDSHGATDLNGIILDEGLSWDEENWRAQYGQVIQPVEESLPSFPVVDIWDWAMIIGTKRNRKGRIRRLVGRLVKRSSKLHPSMPSGGGLLKTAPICEVHLDLVRVTSGQVYKLRCPSARYLASLSTYDSANPTKDWGFPELSLNGQTQRLPKLGGNFESKMIEEVTVDKDISLSPEQLCASQKNISHVYRDRAAERRALHGGFGVGPGQKKSPISVDSAPSSPLSFCPEEAAAESLSISFGVGSYARRILENMGWKEGEALGSSTKGLMEPLQAIGNKGNAGLGWEQSRQKYR